MADVDVSDSITVGDSLHHDIKGANAARIQSAFITGGSMQMNLDLLVLEKLQTYLLCKLLHPNMMHILHMCYPHLHGADLGKHS